LFAVGMHIIRFSFVD